jgi:hypothetical protein
MRLLRLVPSENKFKIVLRQGLIHAVKASTIPIKNHSSNIISTSNEPNDCYWKSSLHREELHYVSFLDESKTPEEGSLLWDVATLVLVLKKSSRNAMHSTLLSVLSLYQFCPEFVIQELRSTCGRKTPKTLREYEREYCGCN